LLLRLPGPEFFLESHMDADIQIRAVGLPQRDLLIEMYDRFEPLGVALGLPPWRADARRDWIGFALGHKLNLAALSPAGAVVGHCFLVADQAGSAELAMFVHQKFRRRGVGTALVMAALEWGGVAGLRRVWTLTSCDNEAALRLQEKCGFCLTNSGCPETELEINLPVVGGCDGSESGN
jgi:GNAT superfamily N-acetyltransferase